MNNRTYKHPKYFFLYRRAETLNIEEWRVDSMIEHVGDDLRKLRHQKDLPWLKEKGRKKYRKFIAFWMRHCHFYKEADELLNWKPEEEEDEPSKKEILGWKIIFLENDEMRPPDADYSYFKSLNIPVFTKEKDRWKEPVSIAARCIWNTVNDLFVFTEQFEGYESKNILGGTIKWKSKTWQRMLHLAEKLKSEMNFPEYSEEQVFTEPLGEFVLLNKYWSYEEWNKMITSFKQHFSDEIVTMKKQVLTPDYTTASDGTSSCLYKKCPWTKRHLEKWRSEYIRKGKSIDIENTTEELAMNRFRPGFHILNWWSVKYCNHLREYEDWFGLGPSTNEIAYTVHSCMVPFALSTKRVPPLEVWEDFRGRLDTKLQKVRNFGLRIAYLGVSEATLFGVWTPDKLLKNKARLEFYKAELEGRDPRSLCFNPRYKKYLKKRVPKYKSKREYTDFGDIRLVNNIKPEDDQLTESIDDNPDLGIKSFYSTSNLIKEIAKLWKEILKEDPNYRPIIGGYGGW